MFQKITPRQTNGVDCGAYLCMFAHLLSLGMEVNFGMEVKGNDLNSNIPLVRRVIANNIIGKCIALPP